MKTKNFNGMRYPSIDDLLKKIDSKYKLAYVTAKVAKLIEKYPNLDLSNTKCSKSVGQALEEILQDHITVDFLSNVK